MIAVTASTSKVGDTLTATVLGGAGEYTYKWTIDGVYYASSESITVPADTKPGSVIEVTVTDEDENEASDSVIVAETDELSIVSVEMADNAGYYIDVEFGKALSSLNVADVSIRSASTGELYSVESVALASDGLNARIAMAGATTPGGATAQLQEGVAYTLTVSQDGQTAAGSFEVPIVRANAIVTGYDASKQQITLGRAYSARTNAKAAIGQRTLSDDVAATIDYEDLLGRTVSVWQDTASQIVRIVLADQTVVYDYVTAKVDGSNVPSVTLSDGSTSLQFETVVTTDDSTKAALVIDENNFANGAATAAGWTTAGTGYTYAKMVLNADGTIQALVYSDAATTVYRADSISETTLTCGGTNVSLKNYRIIKDGELIDVSEIEEGDIVVVYAADKFAEVYEDSITGQITAAYADRFTVDDETYKFANMVYATSSNGQTAATASYLAGLADQEAECTVYFDRKGDARFFETDATTVSTSSNLVVTSGAKGYAVGSNHYISFKAFDGSAINTYNITTENLTSLEDNDGDKVNIGSSTTLLYAGWGATSGDTYTITNGNVNFTISDIAPGKYISIAEDENGNIVSLSTKNGVLPNGTTQAGVADFALGKNAPAAIVNGTTIIYDGESTSVTISTKTYQIKSGTPVYILAAAGAGYTVTKSTYSATKGTIKAVAPGTDTVYYYLGTNTVNAIVIYPNQIASETTTLRGIVTDRVFESSGTKLAAVKMIALVDGEIVEETFTPNAAGQALTPAIGSVYDFELDADGKVNSMSAARAKTVSAGLVSVKDGSAALTINGTKYSKAAAGAVYASFDGTSYSAAEDDSIVLNNSTVDLYAVGTGATSTNYDLVVVRNDLVSATVTASKTTVPVAATALTFTVDTTLPAGNGYTYLWTFTASAGATASPVTNTATGSLTWTPTAANDTLTVSVVVTNSVGATVTSANCVVTAKNNVALPTGNINQDATTGQTTVVLQLADGLYTAGTEISGGTAVAYTSTGGTAVAGNATYDAANNTLTFSQNTENFDNAGTDQVTFNLAGYKDSIGNAWGAYTVTFAAGPGLTIA